jgi:hypothetical protein
VSVLELPFVRSNVIHVPEERWKQPRRERSDPSRREQIHSSFLEIRPWDDPEGAA